MALSMRGYANALLVLLSAQYLSSRSIASEWRAATSTRQEVLQNNFTLVLQSILVGAPTQLLSWRWPSNLTHGGLCSRGCLENFMSNISVGRMQGIHWTGAHTFDADLDSHRYVIDFVNSVQANVDIHRKRSV